MNGPLWFHPTGFYQGRWTLFFFQPCNDSLCAGLPNVLPIAKLFLHVFGESFSFFFFFKELKMKAGKENFILEYCLAKLFLFLNFMHNFKNIYILRLQKQK